MSNDMKLIMENFKRAMNEQMDDDEYADEYKRRNRFGFDRNNTDAGYAVSAERRDREDHQEQNGL